MRVLIIEDDPAAGRRLQRLIRSIDETVSVAGPLPSIAASVAWFDQHGLPDLIFLDIQLEDGPAFEIFNRKPVDRPLIIVSGDDRYALRAFHFRTLDYLLKPVTPGRLRRAWEKFLSHWKPEETPVVADLPVLRSRVRRKEEDRLLLRKGRELKLIRKCNCAYFYIKKKMVQVVLKSGRTYPVRKTLEELESELDTARFFRINRQVIVNIDAIGEMRTVSKSRVRLDLQPATPMKTIVSTERSPHFKTWLRGTKKEKNSHLGTY